VLSEPQRTGADLNFSLLGIPVRVHPMFWLVSVLLSVNATEGNPRLILIWVATVFVSILVHEMGHALAIRWYGWRPWITLYGMGGLASHQPTYYRPQTQIVISLAGPGAGFLLAAVVLAALHALGHSVTLSFSPTTLVAWQIEGGFDPRQFYTWYGVYSLLQVNIFWGLINLLPIWPLDGGQIARDLLTLYSPRDSFRRALWLSIFTAGGLAFHALATLKDTYMALFFGYLAYMSYATLEAYSGRGGLR
jgi:Zn-dependent protease